MEASNGKEVIAMEMDPLKPKIKRLKSEKSEKMEDFVVESSFIKTECHDVQIDSYEMQYDQTELETDQTYYDSKELDLEQGNLLRSIDNWSGQLCGTRTKTVPWATVSVFFFFIST